MSGAVILDDLGLDPPQRRRAEQLLTLRRGLRGEVVVDTDQLAECWPWVVADGLTPDGPEA
jgi:hypothetical protein